MKQDMSYRERRLVKRLRDPEFEARYQRALKKYKKLLDKLAKT